MDLLITGRFHQKSLDLFRGKTVVVEGEDRGTGKRNDVLES